MNSNTIEIKQNNKTNIEIMKQNLTRGQAVRKYSLTISEKTRLLNGNIQ